MQPGSFDPVLERLVSVWPRLTKDAKKIIADVLSKASNVDTWLIAGCSINE